MEPRAKPTLTIVLPPHDLEESIIRQLRFLETRECRAKMDEPFRIYERKLLTERFRNVLKTKQAFRNASNSYYFTKSYSTQNMDLLYD